MYYKTYNIDGRITIAPIEHFWWKRAPCSFRRGLRESLDRCFCFQSEVRTTVFKRDVEQNYSLKTAMARQFLRETQTRFPSLPFSARAIEDEKTTRLGISECSRHGLLQPYPVLTEKHGEYVAQFKYTVLLLPGGTKKITGLPLSQDSNIVSEFEVKDEEMKKLLAVSDLKKPKIADRALLG